METLNSIGLDEEKSARTVDKLNLLLSDVQVFYMNVRGYHWNIKGKEFFLLHEKYEELYNDLADKADEIAERILMLKGSPEHAFSKYLKMAEMKESEGISSASDSVLEVLGGLQLLIRKERELLEQASTGHDEGTAAMLSDYITSQEKLIWMYSAFIS